MNGGLVEKDINPIFEPADQKENVKVDITGGTTVTATELEPVSGKTT